MSRQDAVSPSPALSPRCDDPNCTCRSPELQWFTDQVLRRDATKTDYIVIPLVAGVLARCILADDSDDSIDPEGTAITRRSAARVLELAERGRTDPWQNDSHDYGVIATFVFCNWPSLLTWGGISYHSTTLGVGFGGPSDQRFATAIKYLGAEPSPSLTESVILAMITAVREGRNKAEMPLLGKGGRRLRVILADRIRRQGLATWPEILIAAVDDWTVPTLQRLALHNAMAGDAAIHYAMEQMERAAEGPAAEASLPPAPPDEVAVSGEAAAAESLVNDAVTEIKRLRDQRAEAQRERDTIAQRDARLRSRMESLEEQLADEREQRQAIERENAELRQERDRFAEWVAAEPAVLAEAPPPPADAFAGRRVLFFTGVEAGDARTVFAQGFWDLGAAQVDVYWTDKTRGPDAFPSDAIIAIDVSLMRHSTWNAILDKAKSAGAWCYWGKHGASMMARATAAAWAKRQERGESPDVAGG
jgi:hypothetical protein